MLNHYDKKIVVSGKIIETYDYENSIFTGYERKGGGYGRSNENITNEEQKKDNRQKTTSRARRDVRRIINANVGAYGKQFTAKFITLTFKEHVTDFEIANYEFKKFRQRLNYKLFETKKNNLRYTIVPEFTKKGRIHYHIVFYNIPYIKANELAETWGNGYIKINKIDNVDNVGAYVTKYMTKDNDDERLKTKKSYFNSRGLLKPVEITQKNKVEELTALLPQEKLTYQAQFENEYTGQIIYKQYNLNK